MTKSDGTWSYKVQKFYYLFCDRTPYRLVKIPNGNTKNYKKATQQHLDSDNCCLETVRESETVKRILSL